MRRHGAERHGGRGQDTAPRDRCAHACGLSVALRRGQLAPVEYPPVDPVVIRAEKGLVGRLVLCRGEGERAEPVTGYHVALSLCGQPPEPGERLAEEPELSAIIISFSRPDAQEATPRRPAEHTSSGYTTHARP